MRGDTYLEVVSFFALLLPTVALYIGFFSMAFGAFQSGMVVKALPVLLVVLAGAQLTQIVAYLGHLYILRRRLEASERFLRISLLEKVGL